MSRRAWIALITVLALLAGFGVWRWSTSAAFRAERAADALADLAAHPLDERALRVERALVRRVHLHGRDARLHELAVARGAPGDGDVVEARLRGYPPLVFAG